MKTKRRMSQRLLLAEPLESRTVLSAAVPCPLAAGPDVSASDDTVLAQDVAPSVAERALSSPLQSRDRAGEDSTTGDGRQLRPRDRASQVTATTIVLAIQDQTQQRDRDWRLDRDRGEDYPIRTTLTAIQDQTRLQDQDQTRLQDQDQTRDRVQDGSCQTPAVSAVAAVGVQNAQTARRQQNVAASPLSNEETADLLHMRQEEKLARDVYLHLSAKWNVPIFARIAAAEQQHMDAVGRLLAKYGLSDPIVDNTAGQFSDPQFSALYVQLVQKGSASVVAAYQVGALIEEMDIVDLREALVGTTHTDIQNVYENLLRGSSNHLARLPPRSRRLAQV